MTHKAIINAVVLVLLTVVCVVALFALGRMFSDQTAVLDSRAGQEYWNGTRLVKPEAKPEPVYRRMPVG